MLLCGTLGYFLRKLGVSCFFVTFLHENGFLLRCAGRRFWAKARTYRYVAIRESFSAACEAIYVRAKARTDRYVAVRESFSAACKAGQIAFGLWRD
jgi:hypothetical protein